MCVFCNQNKITGRETDIEPSEIGTIIEENLKTLPKVGKKEVAFFGGTFTAISLPLQRRFLCEVKKYIDKGLIDGIRLSTRPDNINREILELLKEMGVTTIELGVQSLDNKVLELSERGYKKEEVERASKSIKEYDINLGIQVMPGLPGSSFEKDLDTINRVIKLSPDLVRIYPTLVIKDTKLETMYRQGEYKPLGMEEAIKLTALLLSRLEINDIKVIRVGLQPSDDIRAEGVVIDGPFHPAFRELVESEIYRSFFEKILMKDGKIFVEVNKYDVSRAVGIKKSNKKYFGDKLNITVDENIQAGIMIVNGNKYSRKELLKYYTKCGVE
jgi:hypothetical protein